MKTVQGIIEAHGGIEGLKRQYLRIERPGVYAAGYRVHRYGPAQTASHQRGALRRAERGRHAGTPT